MKEERDEEEGEEERGAEGVIQCSSAYPHVSKEEVQFKGGEKR